MSESRDSFLQLRLQPTNLLTVAGTFVCISTLIGFLGRYFWAFDLFSHFRVQYAISLTLLGIILLIVKRYKAATVFIIFACVNYGVIVPLYFGKPPPPAVINKPIRAMLLNVNSRLGNAERVKQLIAEVNPDILVLEEINSKWMNDLQSIKASHPYISAKPRSDNFGIGLFSKLPIIEAKTAYIGDGEVPSILATIETHSSELRIIATHPPPPAGAEYSQMRNSQLEELASHIPQSTPTLLLGDLNTTPWNYYFKRLLKDSGLIDSSQGRGAQATWPSNNPLLLIPLDHCLHSDDIFVINKKIGGNAGSDHYSLIIDFSIDKKPVTTP